MSDVINADTINAMRLNIVDKDNNVRITLAADPDGSASIYINNSNGLPALILKLDESDASSLVHSDRSGMPRLLISGSDESPSLVFLDNGGNARMRIGLDEYGHPSLIQGKDGEQNKTVLTANPEGHQLAMSDHNGVVRSLFAIDRDGIPQIRQYSDQGELQQAMYSTQYGPCYSQLDSGQETCVSLSVVDNFGHVAVSGPTGEYLDISTDTKPED